MKSGIPLLLSMLALSLVAHSQKTIALDKPTDPNTAIVIAGKEYNRNTYHRWLWGSHYRKEWNTPVKVTVVNLDTLAGGLTPYQSGGSRQTKSLRLRNDAGKEYVLRSIDKSFSKALPELYRGTFIENIVNDQASIAHPYAAVTIPGMISKTGLYYTNPRIVYVPQQLRLGDFNKEFGNDLYLLEERPDENWEGAGNLGNSKNIVSTEKLLEKISDDNDNQVDQLMYIKARLFDILVGDWSRHEDQWRWATSEEGKKTIYKPIARDRDQVYTKFDGWLLIMGLSVAGADHLQSFQKKIHDVQGFNFPARNLDRRVANETTLKQWTEAAKELQQDITDEVIENSIKQLPPEIFPISGNEIIYKLKVRRNDLVYYAQKYYKFLAKEVEIVGSNKKELFEINRINDNETSVKVFKITKEGEVKTEPIYERTFIKKETNEIRLYGLSNDDVFRLKGNTGKGIRIRIIGGEGVDSVIDQSTVRGLKRLTEVYDDEGSRIHPSNETAMFIRDDSIQNSYKYDAFLYHKKGFVVLPGPIFLKAGYSFRTREWRNETFGYEHSIMAKYRFNKGSMNIEYVGLFNQAMGKWNILVNAGTDIPGVVNFFGAGNESQLPGNQSQVPVGIRNRFNRLRTDEIYTNVGVNRNIGKHQFIELTSFYRTIQVRSDKDRFIAKYISELAPADLSRKHFVGAALKYNLQNVNDRVIPTSGFTIKSGAAYTYNLTDPNHSFTKLASNASVYVPLLKFLSLGVRVGGATNIGHSELYQLNRLGSDENLRGFRKQRFYGKSSVYNNNELRFIFNTRNKVFNGKFGFVTFFDQGRVWLPGEISNTWHTSFGGGLFIVPFNKFIISAVYGKSSEDQVISAYLGFFF